MSVSKFALMLSVLSLVGVVGCRGTSSNPILDLSGNLTDGGGGDMTTKNYATATPNQIDTNSGGSFGKGSAVKLASVYVTTPVAFFKANSGARCDYEAWVQDTACTTAPCGLVIIAKGPAPDNNGDCPYGDDPNLQSALKGVKMGDFIDVEGVVDTFASQGGSVVQHEVEADKITKGSGSGTPKVFEINDGCTAFVNNGNGFITHEGTLVKCAPATGKFTVVASTNSVTFDTTPGNAHWARMFEYSYGVDGGADYGPYPGEQFASIQGVAIALFGGQIVPRQQTDFVK